MMATLKVGIAGSEGKPERPSSPNDDEPEVWFSSTESFAKILSASNRELLRIIIERKPNSLDQLARLTGKAKSNLSRTLKTMASHGLIALERGERGRISPKVVCDEVQLTIPLVAPHQRSGALSALSDQMDSPGGASA